MQIFRHNHRNAHNAHKERTVATLPIISGIACRAGMRGKNKHRDALYQHDYDADDEEIFLAGMSPLSRSAPISSWCDHRNVPKLKPRNDRQREYIDLLKNRDIPIVIASGSAGTGKTFVANAFGIESLNSGDFEKIVLTRPIVSVDESNFGALPGDVQSKMLPWLMPIYDVLHKYISPPALQNMIAKGTIEIVPLSMMRGRSFERTYIVADEMQNSTPNQMLMLLTRIGEKSKLVVNGDPTQHDRTYDINGLSDVASRLSHRPQEGIRLVTFEEQHIERHPILAKVLRLYNNAQPPAF